MLLKDATKVFIGDVSVSRVYSGSTQVWPVLWGPQERILDPSVIPNTTYSGDYTTGVAFTVLADGRITHLCNRNYDTSGNAVFKLYDDTAGGTVLATMPVPVFYGQQDVPLPTPVPVKAGRRYVLSFYAGPPATAYPYNDGGYPASKSPNLVHHGGCYYAGDTYPTAFGNQYYWLDVIYQSALSPWDSATQMYLDATGLDESYTPALDGLVKGLKQYGLWSKMKAVYPFIGGTADLHKWNLIDPRDTDDAYRLTFTGGAHSLAEGYRPNYVGNSFGFMANSHLVPLGTLAQDSTHMAMYSLLNVEPADRCEMGMFNWGGGTERFNLIAQYFGNAYYYGMSDASTPAIAPVTVSSGLFISTRTGATTQAAYRNGAVVGTSSNPSIPLPPVPVSVGGLTGYAQGPSNLPFGFASIGSGLTDADATNLYEVVQAYQTALGRQRSPLE